MNWVYAITWQRNYSIIWGIGLHLRRKKRFWTFKVPPDGDDATVLFIVILGKKIN